MKLTSILSTLLTSTAVALPSTPSHNEQTLPTTPHPRALTRLNTLLTTTPADVPPPVTYDQNWAGAVVIGAGYRSVSGTLTVPPIRLPAGADKEVVHAVSAWVGMDGEAACPKAIMQVGVDMYMNHSIPWYWAWFEWYPNRSTYLRDFAIHPGDSLTLNVTATALNAALFSITNHRTGQTDSMALTEQGPLLCGLSAEWIVEDFWGTDGVPLADFGRIAFSEAAWATDTGVTGGVEAARMRGVKEAAGGRAAIECGKEGEAGKEVGCYYQAGEES